MGAAASQKMDTEKSSHPSAAAKPPHAVSPPSPALAAALTSNPNVPLLTRDDVARRTGDGRVLLLLHGVVVDVTEFVPQHPGGARAIQTRAGQEAGDVFDRIHSNTTKKSVAQYVIGRLAESNVKAPPPAPQTQKKSETAPLSAVVLRIENATDNVKYITLSCPHRLALAPGGHVNISIPTPDKKGEAKRNPYTPYQCSETSFTLAVKRYPNGVGSNYLHSVCEGETLHYAGPIVPLWSAEKDDALQHTNSETAHTILICGGTGVAPVFSIARYILEKKLSKVTMIGCFQDTSALLLRQEIATLVKDYGDIFELHYVFSRITSAEPLAETKHVHFGRFGKDVVSKLRPAAAAAVCGPPAFVDAVGAALVEGNVCANEQVHAL